MDDETRAAFARIDRYFELSQAQFLALQAEVRELRGEVKELRGEVQELRGEVQELRGEVAQLKERLDRFERSTNERFDGVNDQLRTLRQAQGHMSERIAELRDQVGRHGDRLLRVEDGLVGVNGRLDALTEEVRERFRMLN